MKRLFIVLIFLFLLSSVAFSETIKTQPLPKEVKSFIEKQYPIKSKKIVLYTPFFEESTCPHTRFFFSFLKKAIQDKNMKKVYVLKKTPPFPQKIAEEFVDRFMFLGTRCSYLCVVDLKDKWIYTIDPIKSNGFSEEDVIPLAITLKSLANQ